MVTITEFCEDKCAWCQKETEGARAKFKDGLSGFFCWKCLRQAGNARGTQAEETHVEGAPSRGAA
jgi:hypothetical protein